MVSFAKNYGIVKNRLKGKRVAVIGLGRSNVPLIRFLLDLGCTVIARDKKSREELSSVTQKYEKEDITFMFGSRYLENLEEEYLFLTPGMPKDLPEIKKAVEKGAVIDSEMGLFLFLCQGKTIGITGSAGKTTTTALLGEIFLRSGKKSYVGGNIGNPLLLEAAHIKKDDYAILELSSFQLEMLKQSPDIAAILNIYPNHLDQHRTMEAYVEAKKNIYRFQKKQDVTILNADNEITLNMGQDVPGKTMYFSVDRSASSSINAYLHEDKIMFFKDGAEEEICSISDILLPGAHNAANVMAAVGIAKECQIETHHVREAIRSFRGIEHRISFVREHKGVKYFNDSKATTPESTICAIGSFDDPIHLIAGGYDKKISFDELADCIVNNVKRLILIGVTADKIEEAVRNKIELSENGPEIVRCESLEEAVKTSSQAKSGEIVLLSPACASFDMFDNFEKRGEAYHKLVQKMS